MYIYHEFKPAQTNVQTSYYSRYLQEDHKDSLIQLTSSIPKCVLISESLRQALLLAGTLSYREIQICDQVIFCSIKSTQ